VIFEIRVEVIEGSIEVAIRMLRRREAIRESSLAAEEATIATAEVAFVELEIEIRMDKVHRCRLNGEAETRA